MDYNKFNIEEKYDNYRNITKIEAEKIIDKLSKDLESNNNYDVLILKGKMYLKLDRFNEAIECLKSAIKFKISEEAYDLLSFAYYEVEDFREALHYIQLSSEYSTDEFIFNHKGKLLEKLKDYEGAFDSYYQGLKFLIRNNKSYGDLEIFGENVARVGEFLKEFYLNLCTDYINIKEYAKLYNTYMKLLDVIIKEEENDEYHNAVNSNHINYLSAIENGKDILKANGYYIELINIYIRFYEVEANSEFRELGAINKEYIDKKIKELVDEKVKKSRHQNKYEIILEILDRVINVKNKDYHNYLYYKGSILLREGMYNEGLEVLKTIIDEINVKAKIKIQAYECLIFTLEKSFEVENLKFYKENFSMYLQHQVLLILNRDDLNLDDKSNIVLQYCDKALELNLDKEYWTLRTEEICLYLGEEYEVIKVNYTIFQIIENYNKAIRIYDRLIEFNPHCDRGYYRKGRAIVLVLRILNSSQSTIKDAKGVHELDCYAYSEVINNLNKAISLNDTDAKYFNLFARTHFEIEEYDKALMYIDKALVLDNSEIFININKIFVLIRSHKYTEAIDSLLKLSLKDTNLGRVRKTFLPKKEILNFLMGMFDIHSRQDKIYYLIAYYFYSISEFDFKKSLVFINNAVEITKDERYYLLKGKIYFKNGDYNEAIEACNKALDIDDHYDEAYNFKNICLNKINNK
ncbi:tetratricopeptide repeat protein [Clostridium sp.]|uniref:tetratricopeptide repeat protein n=1 Tax=Clostridium sp. TaxID=1506 RepID=UPI002FCA6750